MSRNGSLGYRVASELGRRPKTDRDSEAEYFGQAFRDSYPLPPSPDDGPMDPTAERLALKNKPPQTPYSMSVQAPAPTQSAPAPIAPGQLDIAARQRQLMLRIAEIRAARARDRHQTFGLNKPLEPNEYEQERMRKGEVLELGNAYSSMGESAARTRQAGLGREDYTNKQIDLDTQLKTNFEKQAVDYGTDRISAEAFGAKASEVGDRLNSGASYDIGNQERIRRNLANLVAASRANQSAGESLAQADIYKTDRLSAEAFGKEMQGGVKDLARANLAAQVNESKTRAVTSGLPTIQAELEMRRGQRALESDARNEGLSKAGLATPESRQEMNDALIKSVDGSVYGDEKAMITFENEMLPRFEDFAAQDPAAAAIIANTIRTMIATAPVGFWEKANDLLDPNRTSPERRRTHGNRERILARINAISPPR